MMAKEIETDGEKDEEMHEKYICYCETNLKKLVDGVAALEEEIPQIEASIEEAVSTKAQLEADLVNRDVQLTQGRSRGLVGDLLVTHTSKGPLSAVSKLLFATKGLVCRIVQDLQQ